MPLAERHLERNADAIQAALDKQVDEMARAIENTQPLPIIPDADLEGEVSLPAIEARLVTELLAQQQHHTDEETEGNIDRYVHGLGMVDLQPSSFSSKADDTNGAAGSEKNVDFSTRKPKEIYGAIKSGTHALMEEAVVPEERWRAIPDFGIPTELRQMLDARRLANEDELKRKGQSSLGVEAEKAPASDDACSTPEVRSMIRLSLRASRSCGSSRERSCSSAKRQPGLRLVQPGHRARHSPRSNDDIRLRR